MKKFTLILFGFLIAAGGCSLLRIPVENDYEERIKGLEETNRNMTVELEILESRLKQLETPKEIEKTKSPEDLVKDTIRRVALEENFNGAEYLISLAKCESKLNPKARNINSREDSNGVFQMNLKAHKDITIEQAQDVEFATRWTIAKIRSNKAIGIDPYNDWKRCRRNEHLPYN